jgi:hypothetical protein
METLLCIALAFVVLLLIYAAIRLLRRKKVDVRGFGRELDDEAHEIFRDGFDRIRARVRKGSDGDRKKPPKPDDQEKGGGSGDDKGG